MSAPKHVGSFTSTRDAAAEPLKPPAPLRTPSEVVVGAVAKLTLEPASQSASLTSDSLTLHHPDDSDSSSSAQKRAKSAGIYSLIRESGSTSPKPSIAPCPTSLHIQNSLINENEALLDAISSDTEGKLVDALYFCSEEIIESPKLISLIIKRVADTLYNMEEVRRTAPKTPEGENALKLQMKKVDQCVSLLNFCTVWSRRNNGTAIFSNATQELKELIELCSKQSDPNIKGRGVALHKVSFVVAVNARDFVTYTAKTATMPIASAFDKILKSTKEERKPAVNQVAQDLYCYQVEVFRAFDQRDLAKSHLGGAFGPSIKRNRDYSNALEHFVVDTVLEKRDLPERVKMIWLFLLIAERAAEIGDFMTTVTIHGALTRHEVDRLKQTWGKVKADYPKLYEQIEEFKRLILIPNYAGFLKKIEERKAKALRSLPFMQSLIQKLDVNSDREKIQTENGIRRYNVKKIIDHLQYVKELFIFQGNWDEKNRPVNPYTDIVRTCLEKYEKFQKDPKEKDKHETLSLTYEPRKLAPS